MRKGFPSYIRTKASVSSLTTPNHHISGPSQCNNAKYIKKKEKERRKEARKEGGEGRREGKKEKEK